MNTYESHFLQQLQAAFRTKKGNVTQEAREKKGDKDGSFPIFDEESCRNAIKLRGHREGDAKMQIIRRALGWARRSQKQTIVDWILETITEDERKAL